MWLSTTQVNGAEKCDLSAFALLPCIRNENPMVFYPQLILDLILDECLWLFNPWNSSRTEICISWVDRPFRCHFPSLRTSTISAMIWEVDKRISVLWQRTRPEAEQDKISYNTVPVPGKSTIYNGLPIKQWWFLACFRVPRYTLMSCVGSSSSRTAINSTHAERGRSAHAPCTSVPAYPESK